MSDRRYSTARWQRLRKQVLAYYGHTCQVEGPRCTGYATTVHHLVPSSQAPHLFWEPANLVASCKRCNYGDGKFLAGHALLLWRRTGALGLSAHGCSSRSESR